MLDGLAISFNLLVLGGHAVTPWRLATDGLEGRRLWGLAALPLLLAVVILSLLRLAANRDAVVAAGMADPLHGSPIARVDLLLVLGLIGTDSVLFFGWSRLENLGWRLASALGLATLIGLCAGGEMLRLGRIEITQLAPLVLATACRSVLALGAATSLVGRRPAWSTAAALALVVYLPCLEGELRTALWHTKDLLTLAAGATLFAASGWLPERYRRPTALAALLLVGFFLSRVETVSEALPRAQTPQTLPVY